MRQRRRHPARPRLEAGRRRPRVDPHDPVGQPAQPLQLAPDERRVTALPAVGQDHDDRAARHPAPAVAVVEGAAARRRSGCRWTSPARPRRPARSLARDGVSAAPGSPVSAASRTRTPRSRPARPTRRAGGAGGARQELQVGARVGLHRARDVAQQHQPAALAATPPRAPAGSDRRRSAGSGAASRARRSARRDGLARAGATDAAASRPSAAPSARTARASSSGASSSKRLARSTSSSVATIGTGSSRSETSRPSGERGGPPSAGALGGRTHAGVDANGAGAASPQRWWGATTRRESSGSSSAWMHVRTDAEHLREHAVERRALRRGR